jgi:hypothetical protein
MMAQFESAQLMSGTKIALHSEIWISIFLFYQALFFITGGKKSPNVQRPYTKAAFLPEHRSVFTQGKIQVTITYHALPTFIYRMLEITYCSVVTYVSSQETEWLRIGAEDTKDNRQSEKL